MYSLKKLNILLCEIIDNIATKMKEKKFNDPSLRSCEADGIIARLLN